ncbi:SCO2522 family protein [Nocardia vermiculata]|uniref:Uncharacterized protein n=1 Tax=Nocardia vermiculata TaxID=257274 RepID=A0A846Y031_9NOCA|nr:SCO2522 family protein [Nocardia vermiculata]NKY50648.1 hypothetical protein [Nocardia vermiculata]
MPGFGAGYSEATEQVRIAQVELAHVSIEAGHFYMSDLTNGIEPMRSQFRRVKRLVDLYTQEMKDEFGDSARISTCFLIDDYFGSDTNPGEILEKILAVAAEYELRIDYFGREAGCWRSRRFVNGQPTEWVELAEMVNTWVVDDPVPATFGASPPDARSGWLCNGWRSSVFEAKPAMQMSQYRPSKEFGRREHSIFLDVEMWSEVLDEAGNKRWSCPFLASIWQLLRLGLIRDQGAPVAQPQPRPATWPDTWDDLPTVVQLEPRAAPFAAYQTLSILPPTYVKIEHAVRTILDHVNIDEELKAQPVVRGAAEGVIIPEQITDRLQHVFLNRVVSAGSADGS